MTELAKATILVIDDSATNRDLICELLGDGYDYLHAETGEEGLAILDERASDIALVLLDIVLPGIDGFQVLEAMAARNLLEELPVIVITSESPEGYEETAFRLGAVDFVTRPYDLTFLKHRVQSSITIRVQRRLEIARINAAAENTQVWFDENGMSNQSVIAVLKQLSLIFDVVRLVDVDQLIEYSLNGENKLVQGNHCCFEVWGKTHRCENCISARAFAEHGKVSKFEFIGNDVYQAASKYIEVDGMPFMLEMVSKVDDMVFEEATVRDSFVSSITERNKLIYTDALTGAYNRYYYEEQLKPLTTAALAIIDVDRFKEVNDTFGHLAGDQALEAIAQACMGKIRKSDALVRFGGDEFVVVFASICGSIFQKRLEEIRRAVEQLEFPEFPDLKTTVSIGGLVSDSCGNCAFEQADKLLYQAKIKRNTVVVG
ncbi:MAG: diguanylate cyclase [Coriobacteriia bacterium]|nr:diguanylate cyclase [Coriobacteriia bacterium]